MTAATHVGLFGKMPSLGDFVERRVHPGFRARWDEWLQDGLVGSQEKLGAEWLDVYLTSPIWRFALSPGMCGEAAHAGVIVPSVDRVGRYFPLTIVATLPAETACVALLVEGREWFATVESILLAVLEGRIADIDELDRMVADLASPLQSTRERIGNRADMRAQTDLALLLRPMDAPGSQLTRLMDPLLDGQLGPTTYWLTEGSVRVSPRLLAVHGLPRRAAYTAMLGGAFEAADWQIIPLPALDAPQSSKIRIKASLRTDRGHQRAVNEDYGLSRPDLGLWVVSDGMGGYQDGALASAAVCDALESATWNGQLEARVDTVIATLQKVHAALRAAAEAADQAITSAATAVVLLVQGSRWTCVWAGDSRMYQLRAENLQQVTRDHSVGVRGSAGDDGDEYFVTAGVGVDGDLTVDVVHGEFQPGDRVLLCSDGLYETLDDQALIGGLSEGAPAMATHSLLQTVLTGPAHDNATAIVLLVE